MGSVMGSVMVAFRLGRGLRRRLPAVIENRVEVDVAPTREALGRQLVVPDRDQLCTAPPARPGIAAPSRRRGRDAVQACECAHTGKCRPESGFLPRISNNILSVRSVGPGTTYLSTTEAVADTAPGARPEGPAMIITTRTPRGSAVAAIAVLALSGSMLSACATAEAQGTGHAQATSMHANAKHAKDSSAVTALHSAMRTLWAQHMEWTYATVVAFAGDSPGLQATMTRLLRNQADIGTAVAGFYGADAGKQLADLLTTHINEAVPVLVAAKAGDTTALTKAVDDWYANAQAIADFLASANPAWNQGEMRQMMKEHITQTIGYASAVLGGNYGDAVTKYDEAEAHMTEMADMLSDGIVAQFPAKF
jgi:hypothetical protein